MEKIRIEQAEKIIKGIPILDKINVSFEQGKIYGLIGRNGSGKTMLLKSICGLTRLSGGKIYVDGLQIGKDVDIPSSLGAIIEVPGFLPNLSGFSNLKYLASLNKQIGDEEIRHAIEMVGLEANSRKTVGKYSLGMRQRLGIAQAIMEDPDILLLDEPMNGLDCRGVEDVKHLLKELRNQGKTIILASHHAEDIDELCDEVYRMEAGKLSKLV